jgi:hypothetical protein
MFRRRLYQWRKIFSGRHDKGSSRSLAARLTAPVGFSFTISFATTA